MTPAIAEIWRHPIKSCGRERMAATTLATGAALPGDRLWAIAHEAAQLDEAGTWFPCQNFARVAKAPGMQPISASLSDDMSRVALSHPSLGGIDIAPDDPADAARLIDWLAPVTPTDRARPVRLVRAGARGMTDSDFPSIALINLASHAEVEARIGRKLSPGRWRGNLLIEGLAPWAEKDMIGQRIRIGSAELEIRQDITRCLATAASTRTGERDADTLGALRDGWGHREFGVYAAVTTPGTVTEGDRLEIIT